MGCTHGRTRKRTRSAPSRRRSPLSSPISFCFSTPSLCNSSSHLLAAPAADDAHLTPVSLCIFILTPPPRPYIVYMLQDLDILEDWTAIRKVCFSLIRRIICFCNCIVFVLLNLGGCVSLQAMASLGPHRVKVDGKSFSLISVNIWAERCHRLACRTEGVDSAQYLSSKRGRETRFAASSTLTSSSSPRQTFPAVTSYCSSSRCQA